MSRLTVTAIASAVVLVKTYAVRLPIGIARTDSSAHAMLSSENPSANAPNESPATAARQKMRLTMCCIAVNPFG